MRLIERLRVEILDYQISYPHRPFIIPYPVMHQTSEASPPAVKERGRLLRILGVGFGLAIIVGNTIGAGILRTPGDVASRLPDVWPFLGVWLAGGLYALLGAISIAELGAMLPRSGGQYVFARYALGDYAGFVVGWSDWISTCGTSAAVSIVIGEYLGALFPLLADQKIPVALVVVMFFTLLQWRGLRWGSTTQNITGLFKSLAFIALVVACFIFGSRADGTTTAETVSTASSYSFIAVILALQAVIYTYDGWTGVVYFSEEVQNPSRDIPRAVFGGVLSVIAIYMLMNLALVYVLPMSKIAGDPFAAGTAANAVFGAHGDTVIRVLMIISMLSAINAYQLMSTRVIFAMSRDGLFPGRLIDVNKGGTPTGALFASTSVAIFFIIGGAFEDSRRIFENIIAVLAFFFVASYAASFISLFVLRRREPDRERPYKAWGYPLTTGLVLVGSIAFLVGAIVGDRRNSFYALLLLALSYPAFLLLRRTASSS